MSENKIKQVCAGIVTFNPQIDLLKKNIESVLPQVQELVIYDNCSKNIEQIHKLTDSYEKCTCVSGTQNKGIAFALNQLCEWATNHSYDWILTLDQDSESPKELVKVLQQYACEDVAVVAPNIVYKNNEQFKLVSKKPFEEVSWVITSASLTNVSIWKIVGGFDEWLFIDCVDYDYGIRVNKAGYKVIKSYETELLHELGNLKCVKILGRVWYVTNHSAFRKYYMTRNAIYLWHKHHTGKPIRKILKNIIKTTAFESRKTEKLLSILHGILDGIQSIR